MSAFLNPVRAADNIGASPDRVQEFDNGDDHPDKHDGDHCLDYDDDNIDKGEVRLSLEKDQVGLNFPEGFPPFWQWLAPLRSSIPCDC